MVLMFTFDIVWPGTYTDSRICTEIENDMFSSLQNIFN